MKRSPIDHLLIPGIIIALILFLINFEGLSLAQSINYTLRAFAAVMLSVFSLAIGFGYIRILLRSKELLVYFIAAFFSFGYLFYINDMLAIKYIAIASVFMCFIGFLSKIFGFKSGS